MAASWQEALPFPPECMIDIKCWLEYLSILISATVGYETKVRAFIAPR
jgi:hypothetical protein